MGAAAIFGLSYSLSSPLIASSLEARGYSEMVISVHAAMYATGVLCMALLLPRLSLRWTPRALVVAALLTTALTLLAFSAFDNVWLWFVLRLVLGCAAETLFVMTEVWINGLSVEAARGRTLATYTALLSLGMAVGPGVLSVVGAGTGAYVFGAVMACVSAVLAGMPMVMGPAVDAAHRTSTAGCWKLAPLALAATVLNAAVETAGLTFMTPYAMAQGWSQPMALRLITCLLMGAVLLQPLIGWLADRVERRALALKLALCSALLALVWPVMLGWPVAAFVMLFVWGGLFVGIYTIMLTVVGARFRGAQLVGVYSAMSVAWGVGALAGPVFAGIAMTVHVSLGLPLFIAMACGAFAIAMSSTRSAA